MSNIGKKIRLKNYRGMLSDLNGKIATITKESNSVYSVLIDETGETCVPYKEDRGILSQCELLEEYSVEDVKKYGLAIHCPTKQLWDDVTQIFQNSPVFKKNHKGGIWSVKDGGWSFYGEEVCVTTKPSYASKGHFERNKIQVIKGEDFVEYNKHLLNKQENQKEQVMEKPKTFIIKGKEHHIDSIQKDLIDIGYTCKTNSGKNIMINIQTCSIDFEKIDKYKYLFRGNLNDNKDVTFQLPEQYSEALKFAKEQLEHPYWSQKPEKQTVTIGSRNVEVTVFKNGTVEFVAEGNIRKDNVTIVQRIINSMGGNTDLQIARYGVHIDNSARFIRIGCEQENNLFSINELQKIVDTYNEMNK